jgi:hypothetical protein
MKIDHMMHELRTISQSDFLYPDYQEYVSISRLEDRKPVSFFRYIISQEKK